MTTKDPFRSPQIGDTIRSLVTGATVIIKTEEAIEFARELVATGAWCVETKGGEA